MEDLIEVLVNSIDKLCEELIRINVNLESQSIHLQDITDAIKEIHS